MFVYNLIINFQMYSFLALVKKVYIAIYLQFNTRHSKIYENEGTGFKMYNNAVWKSIRWRGAAEPDRGDCWGRIALAVQSRALQVHSAVDGNVQFSLYECSEWRHSLKLLFSLTSEIDWSERGHLFALSWTELLNFK